MELRLAMSLRVVRNAHAAFSAGDLEVTCAISTFIRVALFSVIRPVLSLGHVLECWDHQTALASHAALVALVRHVLYAVHQILLGERFKLACDLRELSFCRDDGRKSPARSTLTLVLHRIHQSLRTPIDSIGERLVVVRPGLTAALPER